MDWLTLIGSNELLTEAAKLDLTQNLVVFGVMWAVIKKTIAKHLGSIEKSLDRIAEGLEDHAARITILEIKTDNKEK